jgi:hypothetical protein
MRKHKIPHDLFMEVQEAFKDISRYEYFELYAMKKIFIAGNCGEPIEDKFIRAVQITLSKTPGRATTSC